MNPGHRSGGGSLRIISWHSDQPLPQEQNKTNQKLKKMKKTIFNDPVDILQRSTYSDTSLAQSHKSHRWWAHVTQNFVCGMRR